jgi:hypothetical protein
VQDLIASNSSSSSSDVVKMTILACGSLALIRQVPSRPLHPGMRMSIRTYLSRYVLGVGIKDHPLGELADVDAREPMPARAETPRKVTRERRRSAAKTPIPPDWTPSERVYARAEAHAMGRAQVDDELAEFRIDWGDAGVNRASWDATLINRLKQLICAILAEILRRGHTGLFVTVSEALRLIRDAYWRFGHARPVARRAPAVESPGRRRRKPPCLSVSPSWSPA